MSGELTLRITTPLAIVASVEDVVSLRAEDASGGFGIMPGHADFLTVLDACVVGWRTAAGPWRYCALRGGVLRATGGREVLIACREATLGDTLEGLRERIVAGRAEARDASRGARARHARLHAQAIRRIMRGLDGGRRDDAAFEEILG
jgi:F-type H+-transporting ATPase subunit epsilon